LFERVSYAEPASTSAGNALQRFHVSWKHKNALSFCLNAFSTPNRHPLRLETLWCAVLPKEDFASTSLKAKKRPLASWAAGAFFDFAF
jgi:hypothetical protein